MLCRDLPYATEVFTVDLNTQTASGAGYRINNNGPLCKLNKDEKESWTYQLSSGFRIYWALRQKARPLMLLVVQSFIGN